MNPKKYSDDEAREILKRAVDYQTQDDFQYSREQLIDMGRELGLSEAAIVKAEQERVAQSRAETPVSTSLASTVEIPVEQLELEFRRHRIAKFRQ
jgi:plasmid stability protein